MARRASVQVRVHPDLAKQLRAAARQASRLVDRPVGIPEVSRHLARYLEAQGADGPLSPAWSTAGHRPEPETTR